MGGSTNPQLVAQRRKHAGQVRRRRGGALDLLRLLLDRRGLLFLLLACALAADNGRRSTTLTPLPVALRLLSSSGTTAPTAAGLALSPQLLLPLLFSLDSAAVGSTSATHDSAARNLARSEQEGKQGHSSNDQHSDASNPRLQEQRQWQTDDERAALTCRDLDGSVGERVEAREHARVLPAHRV